LALACQPGAPAVAASVAKDAPEFVARRRELGLHFSRAHGVDVILPAVVVEAVDADLEAGIADRAHDRLIAAADVWRGQQVPLSRVRTP